MVRPSGKALVLEVWAVHMKRAASCLRCSIPCTEGLAGLIPPEVAGSNPAPSIERPCYRAFLFPTHATCSKLLPNFCPLECPGTAASGRSATEGGIRLEFRDTDCSLRRDQADQRGAFSRPREFRRRARRLGRLPVVADQDSSPAFRNVYPLGGVRGGYRLRSARVPVGVEVALLHIVDMHWGIPPPWGACDKSFAVCLTVRPWIRRFSALSSRGLFWAAAAQARAAASCPDLSSCSHMRSSAARIPSRRATGRPLAGSKPHADGPIDQAG